MIATQLRADHQPLYPIKCPICGELLGAFYRHGLSLRAYSRGCTPRCETMWDFARKKRKWRQLPEAWRGVEIATEMLEEETHHANQEPSVAAQAAVADDTSTS
jgi:hypothetical protein